MKTKRICAGIQVIIVPILGLWVAFSERELIIPGPIWSGLVIATATGGALCFSWHKAAMYLVKGDNYSGTRNKNKTDS